MDNTIVAIPSRLCLRCRGSKVIEEVLPMPDGVMFFCGECPDCHGKGVVPDVTRAVVLFNFTVDTTNCIECGKAIIRGEETPFCHDCPLKRLGY